MSAAELADRLEAAERDRTAIGPLSDATRLSEPDAYAVQEELVARRVRAGHRIVGVKLAFTSKAKQEMLGVSEPSYGWLTDDMLAPADGLDLGRLIHPRAEPELGVRLRHDLRGPGVGAEEAAAAIGTVFAALDVVDSRFRAYRFTAGDNIADRAAGGAWVGGPERPLDGLALAERQVAIDADGEALASATGAAALGDPLLALAWLAERLADHPRGLLAGDVVLTGGLTESFPLRPGLVVTATADGLDPAILRCRS